MTHLKPARPVISTASSRGKAGYGAGTGTGGVRTALYARYSSDRQSEHSIEDQLRICRERAEREGWQVVSVYQDAAISGATTDRPGFQALQLAMRRGEFDLVVAEALDRISRDQEHVAAFHKLSVFTGIPLITLSEGEVNALHVGLKGTMNALFLVDLAAKTKRGLEGRVKAGRATGPAPYGYRRVTGILKSDGEIDRGLREIVPEHAAVVQRIFAEYAQGNTPGAIARRLNADHVPGPRATGWNAMTIRGRPGNGDGILRNRFYIGEMVWNRRYRVVDPLSGQAHRRLNSLDARVIGLAPEYRIIDDALWVAAEARLSTDAAPTDANSGRQLFWEKRKPRYLLSGKLRCGACAAPFSTNSGTSYSCNNVQRGMCINRTSMKRHILEARVLKVLAEDMMDPELAATFAEEFTSEWKRLEGQQHVVEAQLKRELDAAERKLANLLDAIADGLRSPGLQAKLSAAEAEQQRLRAAMSMAKPMPVRLLPNIGAAYRQTLARLREALAAGDNPSALETARSLIECVVIHPAATGMRPDITVEGHLAHMLTAAQPGLLLEGAAVISAIVVTSEQPAACPSARLNHYRGAGSRK
ncbi:MAG: recombinase family protein [Rubritepida sp.]|nr:recombinase family protein [Rubritepida sp.]